MTLKEVKNYISYLECELLKAKQKNYLDGKMTTFVMKI